MRIKSCPAHIKAAGPHEGTDDGVFEAIVAAYNLDSVGDKILPGAFAETIKSWQDSGDPIPVYWSHRMDDPDYNIGHVLDIKETDEGLWVKAQLDLESPKAARVYKLMKGRRVTQFSFAYDIDEAAWVDEKGGDSYYELRKLKLHEVGPTPIGANQQTELLDVKSSSDRLRIEIHNPAGVDSDTIRKALRDALGEPSPVTAADVDKGLLREIVQAITEELKPSIPVHDEKATPAPPAATEEPSQAKDAEPARPGIASLRQRIDLDLLQAEIISLSE